METNDQTTPKYRRTDRPNSSMTRIETMSNFTELTLKLLQFHFLTIFMRFLLSLSMEMYDCRIVSRKKQRGNNNKYKLLKNGNNNINHSSSSNNKQQQNDSLSPFSQPENLSENVVESGLKTFIDSFVSTFSDGGRERREL